MSGEDLLVAAIKRELAVSSQSESVMKALFDTFDAAAEANCWHLAKLLFQIAHLTPEVQASNGFEALEDLLRREAEGDG